MDGVNDLLQSTRLAGGVFLDAEFSAPWCVFSGVTAEEVAPFVSTPANIISYHYICEGSMVLELDGHEPVKVESGEVVLLPHNEVHRLGSAPGLPPVSAEDFLQPGEANSLARIVYGGGGATT